MPNFPASFLLLQNEGYLFRSCLLDALTAIRNAARSERGRYYVGFFLLANGLERACKAILVIDHFVKTGTPPTNEDLRKFGHNVAALLTAVQTIDIGTANPLAAFGARSPEDEIVQFVSEFAQRTRYYNLDTLSQGKTTADPLARWNHLMQRILKQHVPARQLKDMRRQAAALANLFADDTIVVAHDLNSNPMDLRRLFEEPQLHDTALRYLIPHIINIIAGLRDILEERSRAAWNRDVTGNRRTPSVPEMQEFLNFALAERGYILRKRRWP